MECWSNGCWVRDFHRSNPIYTQCKSEYYFQPTFPVHSGFPDAVNVGVVHPSNWAGG